MINAPASSSYKLMSKKTVITVVRNVSILLILTAPIVLLFFLGSPTERGFQCNDQSLYYPYKKSTVSTVVLYLLGTLIPAVVMVALEYWRYVTENEAR